MQRTLLVTSGKGGTGKTTVCLLLARALCAQGKNVLLLELDSGLRGLDLLLGVSDKVVYDLSDILAGRCRPAKAVTVCEVPRGNLHLIAAPLDRYYVSNREALAALLLGLSNCYDFLLLDAAAGLGRGFDVAASVCDGALIVSTADPVSIRDAAKTAQALAGRQPRLVVNQFSRKQLTAELPDLDAVIDAVGAQLISVIPKDPLISIYHAQARALPENSSAALEADDLAHRLLGERVLLSTQRIK